MTGDTPLRLRQPAGSAVITSAKLFREVHGLEPSAMQLRAIGAYRGIKLE